MAIKRKAAGAEEKAEAQVPEKDNPVPAEGTQQLPLETIMAYCSKTCA